MHVDVSLFPSINQSLNNDILFLVRWAKACKREELDSAATVV